MTKTPSSAKDSLGGFAYQRLREMIEHGDLKPGQPMVQEALAGRLGLSRTPLRWALEKLAKENYVVLSPRGEAHVRRFTLAERLSILEITAVLEGLACRMAAPLVQAKHIAYLRSLIESAARTVTPHDWSEYRRANEEFHTYLADLAEDAMLSQSLESVRALSHSLAHWVLRPPSRTLPEHLEILDALERRDGDLAETLMVDHIRRTIEPMRRMLALLDLAEPSIQEIAERFASPCSLVVREGDEVVYVHQAYPAQSEGPTYSRIGVRKPLLRSAAGMLVLADASSADVERHVALLVDGGHDRTETIKSLNTELDVVRQNGFAVYPHEAEDGTAAVAVAIRSPGQSLSAMLSLQLAGGEGRRAIDVRARALHEAARLVGGRVAGHAAAAIRSGREPVPARGSDASDQMLVRSEAEPS